VDPHADVGSPDTMSIVAQALPGRLLGTDQRAGGPLFLLLATASTNETTSDLDVSSSVGLLIRASALS
jgi:hypothetical protein